MISNSFGNSVDYLDIIEALQTNRVIEKKKGIIEQAQKDFEDREGENTNDYIKVINSIHLTIRDNWISRANSCEAEFVIDL